MKVHDFPLAWRWTDSRHAELPDAVLAQIDPLATQDARIAHEAIQNFPLTSRITQSADVSREEGCAWLRFQHGRLYDTVIVSWSPALAICTTWQIFTEYWNDFCYPSSDDVAVWPASEHWLLLYHHDDRFEFILK